MMRHRSTELQRAPWTLKFMASFLTDERTGQAQAELSGEIDDEIFYPRRTNKPLLPADRRCFGGPAAGSIRQPDRRSSDGNQTHDEHLITADEQWSSRREQLACSRRCPNETN
jgi:hypothetical protein